MVGLADLPDELLLYICEYAAEGQSSHSTSQLALVSKTFSRIAIPLVYRDFVEDLTNGRLAGVLLSDMTKASYIKSLTLVGIREYDLLRTEATSPTALNESERGRVQEMIHETFDGKAENSVDLERRSRWQEKCMKGLSSIYLLALLLPRLTSLTNLTTWDLSPQTWHVIDEAVHGLTEHSKRTSRPLPLQSLRCVSLESETLPLHTTTPLAITAKWPGVKQLIAHSVGDQDDAVTDSSFLAVRPQSSALETIQLVDSTILGQHLTSLVGAAQGLRSFEHELIGVRYGCELSNSDLSRALSQQTHSIRTIVLEIANYQQRREYETLKPMDFSAFKCLQKLVVGCTFFFGDKNDVVSSPESAKDHTLGALPTCIEEFSLTQCANPYEMAAAPISLQALMYSKATQFQMLRRVAWKIPEEGWRVLALQRNEWKLRTLAGQKDVEFVAEITNKQPYRPPMAHTPYMFPISMIAPGLMTPGHSWQ